MAEADWTDITNALAAADVRKGVTMAPLFEPPDGDFVYAMHTLTSNEGVAGKYCNLANFGPTAFGKGGSVRACMRKYTLEDSFSSFLWFADEEDLTATPVPQGYMLGFSDEETSKLILRKGVLEATMDPADAGVLRTSTSNYNDAQWYQLRLDLIVNPQGDVVLNVHENTDAVIVPSAPTWGAVDGMDVFVDDSVGAITGSVPIIGRAPNGYYMGFGLYNSGEAARVALFDYVEIFRQLTP